MSQRGYTPLAFPFASNGAARFPLSYSEVGTLFFNGR